LIIVAIRWKSAVFSARLDGARSKKNKKRIDGLKAVAAAA
jgi:hypothetical protein